MTRDDLEKAQELLSAGKLFDAWCLLEALKDEADKNKKEHDGSAGHHQTGLDRARRD